MTIAMPDSTEIIKDGVLTPAGIQLLTTLIDAQNSAPEDSFTEEQIAVLNKVGTATLSESGQVYGYTSDYLLSIGAERTTWTDALANVEAGTATLAELNTYIAFIMSEMQKIYNKQIGIASRGTKVEDALWEQETIGQT